MVTSRRCAQLSRSYLCGSIFTASGFVSKICRLFFAWILPLSSFIFLLHLFPLSFSLRSFCDNFAYLCTFASLAAVESIIGQIALFAVTSSVEWQKSKGITWLFGACTRSRHSNGTQLFVAALNGWERVPVKYHHQSDLTIVQQKHHKQLFLLAHHVFNFFVIYIFCISFGAYHRTEKPKKQSGMSIKESRYLLN